MKRIALLIVSTFLIQALYGQTRSRSSLRDTLFMNGSWQFLPVSGTKGQPGLNADWGLISVPGAWTETGVWWMRVPGILQKGKGPAWQQEMGQIQSAWYHRSIYVPRHWKGSRMLLEVEQVSTDAQVWVNGQLAGILRWIGGELDISSWIKPGANNSILVMVVAVPDAEKAVELMGTAESQVTIKDAKLSTRGITGNVWLKKCSAQPVLTDVFVQPSVRRKELSVQLAWEKPLQRDNLLQFEVHDKWGKTVLDWKATPAPSNDTIFSTKVYWPDPVLWDLDSPNLYTLRVQWFQNGQLRDTYLQPFGFREFWIEGRDFFLNGRKINLRPTLDPPGDGMTVTTIRAIQGMRKTGFNFAELWPSNYDQRGDLRPWMGTIDAADQQGFLLSGVLLPFSFYIVNRSYAYQWDKPEGLIAWQQRMQYFFRKQRNHPSIVMWGTTANFFGHAQDQNPLRIGQQDWIKDSEFWQRNAVAARQAIKLVKKWDPTRPVFTHHGTYVGDVYTTNTYLNLLPLQEREEWLSHYSRFGQMPFMAIEFGTPLHCTFLRGRNGFSNTIQTEPLVSEFVAMYLGPVAYQSETQEYRNLIQEHFLGGQRYTAWPEAEEMERLPAFQQLQYLFSRNTWRSWRTWGIPGGMVPWSRGHGWVPDSTAHRKIFLPPSGFRNHIQFDSVSLRTWNYLQPGGWQTLAGGRALVENNNDFLAYISGSRAAFTEKDHHFAPGDLIEKQAWFFNDSRFSQPVRWEVTTVLQGKKIQIDSGHIQLDIAGKQAVSLRVVLPKVTTRSKTDGCLILRAEFADKLLTDTFHFRMIEEERAMLQHPVTIWDPIGLTTGRLVDAGFKVQSWQGEELSALVVGRNTLVSEWKLPGDLQTFVKRGGKVLIMQQHPDKFARNKGLRTSPYVSRYFFPVQSNHPLLKGLDATDFSNWCGESTLTEAYPDYSQVQIRKGTYEVPYYGWHWGNRGGVATGAVEVPHYSGWQPLLSGEFDMAYSPLMQMQYGKGLIVWCQLDIEDHFAEDVVARNMLTRLVQYIDTVKPLTRSLHTVLWGSTSDRDSLAAMGLQFGYQQPLQDSSGLLIVGQVDNDTFKHAEAWAAKGGKVLILPRKSAGNFGGMQFSGDSLFDGGRSLPRWSETAGLSISEIRRRTSGPAVIISGGNGETASEGLFGYRQVGKGCMLFVQADPEALEADSLTYNRYTRWRYTRIITQILSNLGAVFTTDDAFFLENGAIPAQKSNWYHPDYIDDFAIGDDPFRYFRW